MSELAVPAPTVEMKRNSHWLEWPYWLVAIGVLAAITLSRHVRFVESDFFMHIRVGEWIWKNRQIPRTDIFSLVAHGKPWMDHEWLFQVLSFLGYRAGGWLGLDLLRCVVHALSFVFFWRTCISFGIPRWSSLALTLLAACMGFASLEFRPQAFTFLFLSICVYLVYRFLSGRRSPLWLLPIICMVWANMHGAFVAFFAFAATVLAGEIGKHVLAMRGIHLGKVIPVRSILKLAAFVFAAGLATALNPYWFEIWTFPLKVMRHDIYYSIIFEWMPPDFPFFLPFWAAVLALVPMLLVVWRRTDLTHLLVMLSWSYLSLQARRNIALFSYVALPLFGLYYFTVALWISERVQRFRCPRLVPAIASIVLWGVSLDQAHNVVRMLQSKAVFEWGAGVGSKVPAKTADFIQRYRPSGKMYNEYNVGGYLIYRLFPDYLVYQDGRVDVYGVDQFIQYKVVESGNPAWREAVRKYGLNMMVLTYGGYQHERSLISELDAATDWDLVYWDDACLVYLKNDGANSAIAKKLAYKRLQPGQPAERVLSRQDAMTSALPEIDRKIAEDPSCEKAYSLKAYCLANLGRFQEAEVAVAELMKLRPGQAYLYRLRGHIAFGQKSYEEAERQLRAAIRFEPDDPEGWTLLGRVLEAKKQKKSAQDAYANALKRSRFDAEALMDMARVTSGLGDDREAARYWERYLELRPYDLIGLNDAGTLYVRVGNPGRGIALLQRASDLNPQSPAPSYNLACAYTKYGEPARALQYLRTAFDAGGETIRQIALVDKDLDEIRMLQEFKSLVSKALPVKPAEAGTSCTLMNVVETTNTWTAQ